MPPITTSKWTFVIAMIGSMHSHAWFSQYTTTSLDGLSKFYLLHKRDYIIILSSSQNSICFMKWLLLLPLLAIKIHRHVLFRGHRTRFLNISKPNSLNLICLSLFSGWKSCLKKKRLCHAITKFLCPHNFPLNFVLSRLRSNWSTV